MKKNFIRKFVTCGLVCALAVGLMFTEATWAQEKKKVLGTGEYIGEGLGIGGPLKVKVKIEAGKILSVAVISHNETAGIGSVAVEEMPADIIKEQSADVDTVSGATMTSMAIKEAVKSALRQAEK